MSGQTELRELLGSVDFGGIDESLSELVEPYFRGKRFHGKFGTVGVEPICGGMGGKQKLPDLHIAFGGGFFPAEEFCLGV